MPDLFKNMRTFKAHKSSVTCVALSPDGQHFATASTDRTVKLWSMESGKLIRTWEERYVHRGAQIDWSPNGRIVWSPDGLFIACGGNILRVFPLDGSAPIVALNRPSHSLTFSPDGRTLIACNRGYAMSKWAIPSGTQIDLQPPIDLEISHFAYTPDGLALASVSHTLETNRYYPVISVHDAASGTLLRTLRHDSLIQPPLSILFSPNGQYLIALHEATFGLWDWQVQQAVAIRSVGKKHFLATVFARDGSRLYTGGNDHLVRVWDTKTWMQTRSFDWQIGGINSIDTSHDGCTLVAGGKKNGFVVIWDAE